MFAKDYRRIAWKKLSGNWGIAIVIMLLYSLICGALSSFGAAYLIFSGVFGVGMSAVMLKLSRSGQTDVDTMFDGFRRGLVSNILAGLLVSIYTFLWTLLFIIPGIIKAYAYSMTYYILADNPDMAASDAIKESCRIMDGKKWRLFCLDLSFIGWWILVILTFGILAFWVSPYTALARAEFYESVKQGATLYTGETESAD